MAIPLWFDYTILSVSLALSGFASYKFFVTSGRRSYLSWISFFIALTSLVTILSMTDYVTFDLSRWVERISLLTISITLFYAYYSKWG